MREPRLTVKYLDRDPGRGLLCRSLFLRLVRCWRPGSVKTIGTHAEDRHFTRDLMDLPVWIGGAAVDRSLLIGR
jgi:hypothetical protein